MLYVYLFFFLVLFDTSCIFILCCHYYNLKISKPFYYSDVQDRVMLTGRHIVRDVSCKNCDTKLGWIYEFAMEENQRYKEGRVILERALVTEGDGLEHEI